MSLGENIRKARKNKKLTQKELGKLIDRTEITIRKYEADNVVPSIEILQKIADVLADDINNLLGFNKIEVKVHTTFKEAFFQFITDKRYLLDAREYETIEEYNEEFEKLYESVLLYTEFYCYKLKKTTIHLINDDI